MASRKDITAPENFGKLSDTEYDQLGHLLLPGIEVAVKLRGMKLQSVVLDQSGIVAKILWDCNAPLRFYYKLTEKDKTAIEFTNK